MKRLSFLMLIVLGVLLPASAQSTVFNCQSFSTTGACGGVVAGYGNEPFVIRNGGYVSGNQIDFVPANSIHNGYGMWYYTPVNVQNFTTHFTFIPNGQNLAFVVQNTTNNPGYQGNIFASGAGCEAGFYQDFVPGESYPNNLFALEFDSGSWLTEASEAFTYSSVQTYQSNQSPCLPNDNGPNWVPISKISTYPVPLNSPANAQYKTTGHVYSATVTYNGTNLTLSMYDETAGGSCPGATCFTRSWSENIPSLVGGPTALVGFTAGINVPNLPPLYVNSWSYTEASTAGTSGGTTTPAATPTFSPGAGTYASAQSVSISDSTSGATLYYTTNGATPNTSSTRYTGPIAVDSTETLRAMAVATGNSDSAVASATYTMSVPTSGTGSGEVINYSSGFSSHPSQLWLGGSATYSGSSLELTGPSGNLANNVWYETPVNVQNFTTTFTWTAACPAKGSCGDGLGFMIISSSNPSTAGYNYSGSAGSQLSWSRCSSSGCKSIKSFFVKFDLYNNTTESDKANLTGFYSGGEIPQPPNAEYDMAPSGINMQSGHLMKATLTYNGSVLMETVTDTVNGATYRNSYSANIPSLVGGNTALVGFGGASGGASVTQDIKSWTYTVE